MDIHKVTVTLTRPRGSFPSRVEFGYYTVNDGTVTLVEENGVPVDRFKFSRKLPPGGDARGLACAMTRSRYSKSTGDFNRPLSYPKVGF